MAGSLLLSTLTVERGCLTWSTWGVRPPTLNATKGGHFRHYMKKRDQWGGYYIVATSTDTPIEWSKPDRYRMFGRVWGRPVDVDAIGGMFKAQIDILVREGWLPEDDPEHAVSMTCAWRAGRPPFAVGKSRVKTGIQLKIRPLRFRP